MALLLQNRIILLQRINPGLQKVDLIQSLQGSLLESRNLLQLLLLVKRELQILANLSKTFRLISDLLRQTLSFKIPLDIYSKMCTSTRIQDYLPQARTDNSRPLGPQQPPPQSTCPLPVEVSSAESGRHLKQQEDL